MRASVIIKVLMLIKVRHNISYSSLFLLMMIVRFVNILHTQVYDFSYVDMESMPDVSKMKR